MHVSVNERRDYYPAPAVNFEIWLSVRIDYHRPFDHQSVGKSKP